MRWFILGSGLFELAAVAGILFSAKGLTKGAIIRITFGLIAAYRIALHVQDAKFCPCLGTFATEFLGGSNGELASAVLGGIVLFVLALNELMLRHDHPTASAEEVP